MRRWRRPASSDDEIKQTAIAQAANTASHVNPRCRHDYPPFSCPSREGYAQFQSFLNNFDWPSYHRYSDARRDKRTLASQEMAPSKLRARRHDSPVLIFDELKHDLLLKNRQWPSGNSKIARRGPPATAALSSLHAMKIASRVRCCRLTHEWPR